MAIKTFNQPADIFTVDDFCTFLEENKSGTVLENAVIGKDSNEEAYHYFTITLGDATIKMYSEDGYTSQKFLEYTMASGINADVSRSIASGTKRMIKIGTALLCNNGLLINYSFIAGSGVVVYSAIVITVDSEGDLSLIRVAGTEDYHLWNTKTTMLVYSYASSKPCSLTLTPQYGCNLTSIAAVPVICTDSSRYLPDVFSAIATQIASESINIVSLDGVLYVTNGIIYLRES